MHAVAVDVTLGARAWRVGRARARGLAWRMAIRAAGGQCGPGLEVDSGATLRHGAHSGLRFGVGVRLGRGVVVDVPWGGVFVVGDRVKIQHYSVVAAVEHVMIGARTQVAEHVSIRDSDHGALGEHHNIATAVTVGEDVPRVQVMRGAQRKAVRYFGPYSHA